MSEKNENRWWENYLVRYLVPSIAGMFILMWLNNNSVKYEIVESGVIKSKIAEVEVIKPEIVKSKIEKTGILEQYFPMLKLTNGKDFNTASLTVWLLLGTLYCYIASYPILVLHAVRVYLLTKKNISPKLFVLFILLLLNMICFVLCLRIFFLIPVFVIIFSSFQYYFLYKVVEEESGYDYMKHLAKAKNDLIPNTEINTEKKAEINAEKKAGYIKDITDSYKHLREHGNTALIILLEILLAFFLYVSLRYERENGYMDFSIVSIILIIWIIPAAGIYFYGHILERKFSGFENEENE